jgi:hypothetical protein
MADRQFSDLNSSGVSRPLQDLYSYYAGNKYQNVNGGSVGIIKSPESYFPDSKEKQDHFIEMLARLLTPDEFSNVAAGWHLKPDASLGKRTAIELTVGAWDPDVTSARQKAKGPSPTYVDPQAMWWRNRP